MSEKDWIPSDAATHKQRQDRDVQPRAPTPAAGSALAERLFQLQRTAGNTAVLGMLTVQRQHRRHRRGTVGLSGVTVLWQANNVFIQRGPTCSAASLVAELAVRDNDSRDPQHGLISRAMANVAAYANAHRDAMLPALERLIVNGANRLGERLSDQQIRQGAEHLFRTRILDSLANAGSPISDRVDALARLNQALFHAFLSPEGDPPTTAQVSQMLQALGLPQQAGGAVDNITFTRFDEIFINDLTIRLQPGAAVRTVWWVRRRDTAYMRHAFTIGQRRSGTYYLYDQGVGYGRESSSLEELRASVTNDIHSGAYWLSPIRVNTEAVGEANFVPTSRQ